MTTTRTRRSSGAALAVLLAVVLAGCGDDDDGVVGGNGAVGTSPARVLVDDAVGDDDALLVVEGLLLAAPVADPLLCSALAESYPPQCGGARLSVPGLDVDRLPATQTNEEAPEAERVVWTDAAVALAGTVSGDGLLLVGDGAGLGGGVVLVEAVAGPVCPVETSPPDPACADRPVAGAGVELWGSGGTVAAATTDDLGVAVFMVAEGDYQVVPLAVDGLVAPERGTVHAGPTATSVTLEFDTGVR